MMMMLMLLMNMLMLNVKGDKYDDGDDDENINGDY
jgi:hypothetical protein